MLIKHTLDRTGDLQVEIAVTGEAALTLAAEHPPDLVVLDLNLPGLRRFGSLPHPARQAGFSHREDHHADGARQ